MAKLYRPTYRKCIGGKMVEKRTAKWYAKVKLNGKRKAVPLATDKRASEIMLADLLRQEAMGQVGAVDPAWTLSDPRLASLVAAWPTLPEAVRAALCEIATATQRRAA